MDISKFSSSEIYSWIKGLGSKFEDFAEEFKNYDFDGSDVLELEYEEYHLHFEKLIDDDAKSELWEIIHSIQEKLKPTNQFVSYPPLPAYAAPSAHFPPSQTHPMQRSNLVSYSQPAADSHTQDVIPKKRPAPTPSKKPPEKVTIDLTLSDDEPEPPKQAEVIDLTTPKSRWGPREETPKKRKIMDALDRVKKKLMQQRISKIQEQATVEKDPAYIGRPINGMGLLPNVTHIQVNVCLSDMFKNYVLDVLPMKYDVRISRAKSQQRCEAGTIAWRLYGTALDVDSAIYELQQNAGKLDAWGRKEHVENCYELKIPRFAFNRIRRGDYEHVFQNNNCGWNVRKYVHRHDGSFKIHFDQEKNVDFRIYGQNPSAAFLNLASFLQLDLNEMRGKYLFTSTNPRLSAHISVNSKFVNPIARETGAKIYVLGKRNRYRNCKADFLITGILPIMAAAVERLKDIESQAYSRAGKI